MNNFKLQLLAATAAISAMGGTAAQAQFAFPAATLHGAGASLPQTVVRQTADCYGLKTDLGFGVASGSAPAAQSIFDFNYDTPAADTLGNHFDCSGNSANAPVVTPFNAPRIVQPNVQIFYLSTGSGQGVTAFLNGRVSSNVVTSATFTPYVDADGYQFSMSDTALSSGNVTTYNTAATVNPFSRYAAADTAANLFGPAIQVPHAIAPVAITYDPVYAKVRNNGGLINEYRFTITGARADGSGGLKLTRAQYCGIVNGVITNFNQLPTNVVNKDVNDPATFNVPIKLVGRSETSGTSSLFTRAIAAQCTGLSVNTGIGGTAPSTAITNKFGNSENKLPTDGSVVIAGTAYTSTASAVSPTNSLSGAFFDKATGTISIGTEAAGLFGVANGNDGVAQYVNYHPDPSATIGDRSLNGHVAYMSPENALPATLFNGSNNYGLNTASLQVGATTAFAGPDAKQATAAFTGIQPPQSKGTAGAYDSTVTATNRNNPLDWVQLADKSVSLAQGAKGYPLVGTTNILLYTCYATPDRRQAVNGWVATIMGKTTKDFNNQLMPAGLASDATFGIYAKNALSPMPAAWRNAVTETFLKSSVQLGAVGDQTTKLGLRNLWIQDKIPTTPTGAGATTAGNATVCTGKPGA